MTQSPKNLDQESTDPITDLTLAELEHLIEKIVKRTLQDNNKFQTSKPSQIFLETFGSWVDKHNSEEIIHEIYQTRTLHKSEN